MFISSKVAGRNDIGGPIALYLLSLGRHCCRPMFSNRVGSADRRVRPQCAEWVRHDGSAPDVQPIETIVIVPVERTLADGVEITVTGQGRTRGSIQRTIPAHAKDLAALGSTTRTEQRANGVKLVVTSTDPFQAVKLKALGFAGIMVQGGHHQPHHLLMAKGQFAH